MKIANWVRTGDSAAFPFTSMPAYTAVPFVPCLFYLRLWTFGVAFLCTIVVWWMTKKGYTLLWAYNRLRGRLRGNRMSARPVWYIRRYSHLSDPARGR